MYIKPPCRYYLPFPLCMIHAKPLSSDHRRSCFSSVSVSRGGRPKSYVRKTSFPFFLSRFVYIPISVSALCACYQMIVQYIFFPKVNLYFIYIFSVRTQKPEQIYFFHYTIPAALFKARCTIYGMYLFLFL